MLACCNLFSICCALCIFTVVQICELWWSAMPTFLKIHNDMCIWLQWKPHSTTPKLDIVSVPANAKQNMTRRNVVIPQHCKNMHYWKWLWHSFCRYIQNTSEGQPSANSSELRNPPSSSTSTFNTSRDITKEVVPESNSFSACQWVLWCLQSFQFPSSSRTSRTAAARIHQFMPHWEFMFQIFEKTNQIYKTLETLLGLGLLKINRLKSSVWRKTLVSTDR